MKLTVAFAPNATCSATDEAVYASLYERAETMNATALALSVAAPVIHEEENNQPDYYDIAEGEIEWVHSEEALSSDPAVAKVRAKILAGIAALEPWHRGAFALHFSDRKMSPLLTNAMTSAAMLVRLDCMDHPAAMSRATLEKESVARLEALVRENGKDALVFLEDRARQWVVDATDAYRQQRGRVPSRVPGWLD